jgi:putative hydrolase of the HAD superfamily
MPRFEGAEIEALLLDLDDTLLDNRRGLREAWDRAAALIAERQAGLERSAVREQIGRSTAWFWAEETRHRRGRLDLPWARREILAHVLAGLGRDAPDLVEEAERLYTECRDRALAPLPGAIEAVRRLRRMLPRLALVTNGAASVQRAKIERFALADHFDVIVIEGEFGAGKPDPSVFAHALERIGVVPVRSLMVGDNYEADVLGALHAGLHAAWVDAEGSGLPPQPAPRPHATVRSIVELCERIAG